MGDPPYLLCGFSIAKEKDEFRDFITEGRKKFSDHCKGGVQGL
jgi:hypothetical protein